MTATPPPPDMERLLGERAWLTSLARQLVRRDELADEAAHEALAAAWAASGPAQASVRRWLAAILKKQLAGRRRSALRQRAREVASASSEPAPPTVDVVARFEVQRAVADAVLALPEPYRTTVLRRFWEDEAPAVIAAAMQVPVETVRTRCKRGLAMLRERLDAAHGGERRAWALPLWIVGRRSSSAWFGIWCGVTLMTTLHKVAAALLLGGIAWLCWSTMAPPGDGHAVVAAGAENAANPATTMLAAASEAPAAPAVVREPAQRAVGEVPAASLAAVITGTVVDDATASPLPGLRVRLVVGAEDVEAAVATTGDDGAFELRHDALVARDIVDVFVSSSLHALGHARVQVMPGERGGLRADSGAIRLVGGTHYSGRVVDLDGVGVPGARLLLPLRSMSYGGYGQENMLDECTSVGVGDASGVFRLGVAIAPAVHDGVLFAVAPTGIGWCRIEPSRLRREVGDLVIRLRPSGALRVVVRDADGKPRPGVTVHALPRVGPIGIENHGIRHLPSRRREVVDRFQGITDALGVVRLFALPIGEADAIGVRKTSEFTYDVDVLAEGFPKQPLHRCHLQAGGVVDVDVRLVALRAISVAATVVDDVGAPIPNARVIVHGDGAGADTSEAFTDAAGRGQLTVGASATTWIVVRAEGHSEASQKFDAGAVTGPIEHRVTLTRVTALEGVVVDQFGQPLAGMSVFWPGGKSVPRTDAEGRFRTDSFPVGDRELVVALGSGMDKTQWAGGDGKHRVNAAHGRARLVMHRRPGNCEVVAALIDARTGEPLEATDATLRLYAPEVDAYVLRKNLRTSLGLVTATATTAGRWRLDVVTATGHRGSTTFEIGGEQPRFDLRLGLSAPGTLTGRVQFAPDLARERIVVTARLATPDRYAVMSQRYPGRWQADAASQGVHGEGMFGTGELTMQPGRNAAMRLDRVMPDEDVVLTATGDGVVGEATVRVTPGGTADVVIELRPKPR